MGSGKVKHGGTHHLGSVEAVRDCEDYRGADRGQTYTDVGGLATIPWRDGEEGIQTYCSTPMTAKQS